MDFARSVSLWEWSSEPGRRTRRLAATVVFHFGDDVHTEFAGFSTDARVLVLTIDQGDDEPVAFTSASASRPHDPTRRAAGESVRRLSGASALVATVRLR